MTIGAFRCQAISAASGEQCKRAAVLEFDGWYTCAEPMHVEQGTDPDHVGAALDHIGAAMQHGDWTLVPGSIRHLIEWAWVDLMRERGEVGP